MDVCSRTGRVEETARLTGVPASSRSLASSPMDPQPYNGRLVSRTGRIPPRLRLLPIPDRDQHFQIARFPPLDAPPSGRTPRPRPASARSVATRRQDPASAVAGTGFRASMNPIRPSRPPPGEHGRRVPIRSDSRPGSANHRGRVRRGKHLSPSVHRAMWPPKEAPLSGTGNQPAVSGPISPPAERSSESYSC